MKLIELRDICKEMRARIVEERDPARFGDIDPLIDKAAKAAAACGLPNPPVERLLYDRDHPNDTPRSRPPVASAIYATKPEFAYVFGLRFNDPHGGTAPAEIATAAIVDGADPTKSRQYDPWEHTPKQRQRETAKKHLRRWVRFLECEIIGTTPARAGATAAPTSAGATKPTKAGVGSVEDILALIAKDCPPKKLLALAYFRSNPQGTIDNAVESITKMGLIVSRSSVHRWQKAWRDSGVLNPNQRIDEAIADAKAKLKHRGKLVDRREMRHVDGE